MYYYSHNIGDFDRATRHLTRIERSIYRDLLDVYYDTEKPLTLDRAALCRKIIARSNEEATAVEQVLNEFFIETPNGWFHSRCEEEIAAYRASNSQKSAAGKASAAARAARKQQALNGKPTTVGTGVPTDAPTPVEQPHNGSATKQEPVSVNHEPETNNDTASASASSSVPSGFDEGGFAVPKEAPLPMREQPPLSEDPAIVLTVRLRRLGVNVMSTNPNLLQWVADGVPFEQLAEAVAVARENKPEPEKIAPGYLVPILHKLRNPEPGKPARQAAALNEKFNFTHLDRSGDRRAMEEGMKRHGITVPGNDEEIEI